MAPEDNMNKNAPWHFDDSIDFDDYFKDLAIALYDFLKDYLNKDEKITSRWRSYSDRFPFRVIRI